ncbi:restriction endonuclease subunit S [Metabacillus niabensis]|uniref:restriction endonuclease subunit S n=1 Tax=Metabacillus niabensis TaxID=324854 RepID=UPI0009C7CE8F|nr:type I restriction-modification system specificity subunit [Mycobacteroides abscessus subsp. abscessus]
MTSNDWNETTLGEISIGNKGNYGIAASAVEYSEDLYTYLRITDIDDDGKLLKDTLKSVDDDKAEKYLLKPNDIVFARTGNSTGRSYFYDGSDGPLVYAGFLIKFSLDPEKVNPKYIKYFTLSNEYKGWVSSFSTGSTRGNINAKTYADMKIKLPPRGQQDFLVKILSSIDEKIDINNQLNKTLEELTKAIFKQWFIDFEFPNKNGEPYKSSGGQLVESNLGLIPEGWHVGRLSDLVEIRYGKDHKKLKDGDIPVYGSGGVMRYVDTPLYTSESVLVPRKGTLNNVIYTNQPFWSVDTMFYSAMKERDIAKYIYCFLKTKDLASMNTGSAVPSMTTALLNDMPIITKPLDIINSFDKILTPIFSQISLHLKENEKLKQIRDNLFSKLMSGEISVPLDN